jgi:hypothetical protein
MPTFATDAQLDLYAIPEEEREQRFVLQSDTCVIDDKLFFVRGCIEIPVDGANEPFIWSGYRSTTAPGRRAGARNARHSERQMARL